MTDPFSKPLALQHAPVAIAFMDRAPADIPHVSTVAPASCGYWPLASEGHVFYTEARDHQGCPVGAHTHGVPMAPETAKELEGVVATMVGLSYIRTEEVAALPTRKSAFGVAVYAPLAKCTFAPDLVLVRANAATLMLLSEAAQAAGVCGEGPTVGRPTCAILPQSMQAARTGSSFGCIGNRVYTGLDEGEGYFAIPAAAIAAVAARLPTVLHANEELRKFHQARACAAQ